MSYYYEKGLSKYAMHDDHSIFKSQNIYADTTALCGQQFCRLTILTTGEYELHFSIPCDEGNIKLNLVLYTPNSETQLSFSRPVSCCLKLVFM